MTVSPQPSPGRGVFPGSLFVPKLVTVLREGYRFDAFRADCIAGITVAIVALPLAMALAIASGTTPDKGLLTAAVAGFLISALGGSRFQIGGPTGAFVVVVFNVIDQQGFDGLVIATFMAGIILIVAGFARLGTWIKYIPEPVVTGFTAGIAVIILASQFKDFFGLSLDQVPAAFFDKWPAFWAARDTLSPATLGVALGALALIVILRRYAPRLPGFLIAVALASVVVLAFGLPVETIGTRFGGVSSSIPMPHLPEVTFARLGELLPSAFTIAFLAGVESLLSAVVADGMTGRRHRSNCELVAQGVANAASALVGGIPATGAIARTATNVRTGARSPVAGMIHAVIVLVFMLVLAPVADVIPLASLAAVLVVVAVNMSEMGRFRALLRGPWGDRIVLLLTFGLTVAVDLVVAIEVGVVLAAVLFMHRMTGVVAISSGQAGGVIEEDVDDFATPAGEASRPPLALPRHVVTFHVRGPLFFGVAGHFAEVIDRIDGTPRVLILRMREVPMVDASGASRLKDLLGRCRRQGTVVLVTGLQPQPRKVLTEMAILKEDEHLRVLPDIDAAVAAARSIVGED